VVEVKMRMRKVSPPPLYDQVSIVVVVVVVVVVIIIIIIIILIIGVGVTGGVREGGGGEGVVVALFPSIEAAIAS